MGPPTQKSDFPKKAINWAGNFCPRANPSKTNPTNLIYSSNRFAKVTPTKDYVTKVIILLFIYFESKISNIEHKQEPNLE